MIETQATPTNPIPTSSSKTGRGPARLIILCDGTWQERRDVKSIITNQGVSTTNNGDWYTNIALLSQCISPHATIKNSNGIEEVIPQIVFYQDGIGSTPFFLQRAIEGGTGNTLDRKVMEAYSFIVDNYQSGDSLFFFGFSRGAYTARTIAAFVNYVGILSKQERSVSLMALWHAFNERNPSDPKSVIKSEEAVFKELKRWPSQNAMFSSMANTMVQDTNVQQNPAIQSTNSNSEKVVDIELNKVAAVVAQKTPQIVPPMIEVVGVFDTVGALGIPGHFLNPQKMQYYSFFDPILAPNVRNAFHAVSLGEDRKDFLQTLWVLPKRELASDAEMRKGQTLRQAWFTGTHSDVGGGWAWHGLSDITLAWMISQLVDRPEPLLSIDIDLARKLQDRRLPWARQPEHPTRTSIMYQATRNVRGWTIPKKLTETAVWRNILDSSKTHELIHHSVFVGKQYTNDSLQFKLLRESFPEEFETMWKMASDPDSLGKTEKYLRWTDEESQSARSLMNNETLLCKRTDSSSSEQNVSLDDLGLPPSKPKKIPRPIWKAFVSLAYAPSIVTSTAMNLGKVPQKNLKPPKLLMIMQKFDKDPQEPFQPETVEKN